MVDFGQMVFGIIMARVNNNIIKSISLLPLTHVRSNRDGFLHIIIDQWSTRVQFDNWNIHAADISANL
jgi:hypothetical protein